ncbi:MAG: hypothetical protein ACRCYU_04915, partial [Nocardioides sp.]
MSIFWVSPSGASAATATRPGWVTESTAGVVGSVPGSGSSMPSGKPSEVRLVTGEVVPVLTDSRGKVTVAPNAGPKLGKQGIRIVTAGEQTYAIPRIPATLRGRVDISAFNVDALASARRDGTAPYRVTFAAGSPARDLPG